MRRLLQNVAGLLLAVAFVLPTQAQPTKTTFPTNSIEARATIRSILQGFGSSPNGAIDQRATLQKLMAELQSRYSDAPTVDEIKRLLLLMEPNAAQNLDLIDPDRAPLKGVAFARQNLREPNPDLRRVQEQTWPPDLTHGEKVALQSYSGSAFGTLNSELRNKGSVNAVYAMLHSRLQSAFRKAQPFDPPVMVSRGIRIDGPGKLDAAVDEFKAAHKEKKAWVMRGYGSTTVGSSVHPSFQGNLHLHVKARHGLDVYPISHFPQEREFLLNHNSTYRVTEIRQEGGRWVIQLDQIPPKEDGK